jgi:hypothetical protein
MHLSFLFFCAYVNAAGEEEEEGEEKKELTNTLSFVGCKRA